MGDTAHARTDSGDAGCVTVLVVGGTGESYPGDRRTEVSGLLANVTDALDERFIARWVGYPASYGPAPRRDGMSYTASVAAGMAHLEERIHDTAGPLVVIGYSQGAVVIRRLLAEIDGDARRRAVLDRLLAIGVVADPHQPPGAVTGCDGWGVAGPGPKPPSGVPAWWVGAPDDMICNASSDSLIRDIADLTDELTLRTPRQWLTMTWGTVRTNSFQNAAMTSLRPAQWRRDLGRLRAAWREVRGYLPRVIAWRGWAIHNTSGGRHTAYAEEPYRRAPLTDPLTTGCEALARWLQVQVTFAIGPGDRSAGEPDHDLVA